MINKILISKNKKRIIHRDRRLLGIRGENLQDTLLFCLDEDIEGSGILEIEFPDGNKDFVQLERVENGYQLEVKSILLDQIGYVKFQLRILQNEVEVFKSLIFEMEVKESLNAIYEEPEKYPTWLDNLESLKSDLEKSESERVSNENERISAEEARQENFTEMQNTVSNAVSNIKDLTDKYNENDEQKTEAFNKNFEEKQKAINDNAEAKIKAFNDNVVEQTNTFNSNSEDKLSEYNKNHTDKMKEFNDNFDTKTKTFNNNAQAKLDEYNKNDIVKTNTYNANDKTKVEAYNANDKTKTEAYNNNTVLKEKAYNDNADIKVKEYNNNAEQKEKELEDLAEEKINEYNQNSTELKAKVEQVQTENEALKAENKLIKEQFTSASVSGNNIHVEDSGSLDFDWKIKGGHAQKTREGYNLLDLSNFITQTKNGVTVLKNEDNSIKVTGTNTDKIYEQYGASPSPGFPSEVETVGSNTNYFDKDNEIINGYHLETETGEVVAYQADFYQKSFIEVRPNTDYFLTSSSNNWLRHIEYDENKNFIYGSTENSFTTKSNTRYIRLSTGKDRLEKLKLTNGSSLWSPYRNG